MRDLEWILCEAVAWLHLQPCSSLLCADAKGRNTTALACISSWRWQRRELVCEGFPSGFGEPSSGT